MDHIGGGVEGCCPAHNIIGPKGSRLVGGLHQLMVGDGEGLVVDEGIGSRIGAGLLASWDRVCWDLVKRRCRKRL